MSEQIQQNEDCIDSLRCKMDADARFRRAISGYDPYEVRAYVENVKRIFAQQTKASKQEQETLIAQLDSAKSEIQARNYAIKKLKDLLVQREAQLSTANTRINTLLQSIKKHDAEREELDRLRAAAAAPDLTRERLQALQDEAQQLREALAQSASIIDTWQIERERLIEDNERLKQELVQQRTLASRPAAPEYETRAYAPQPMPARQPYAEPYMQQYPPVRSNYADPYAAYQQQPPRQPYADPYAPQNPPVRQNYDAYAAQNNYAPVKPAQPAVPKDFSEVADKLAAMFADAYLLISQFRNGAQDEPEQSAQRPNQPYMQILRPDGGSPDNPLNRK